MRRLPREYMSSQQVPARAKQTLKTVKEALAKAEESTHKALERAAPALQRSIDSSFEATAKGFNTTMKAIEGATKGDQVRLLKVYRRFLVGQASFVESRIKALEGAQQEEPRA